MFKHLKNSVDKQRKKFVNLCAVRSVVQARDHISDLTIFINEYPDVARANVVDALVTASKNNNKEVLEVLCQKVVMYYDVEKWLLNNTVNIISHRELILYLNITFSQHKQVHSRSATKVAQLILNQIIDIPTIHIESLLPTITTIFEQNVEFYRQSETAKDALCSFVKNDDKVLFGLFLQTVKPPALLIRDSVIPFLSNDFYDNTSFIQLAKQYADPLLAVVASAAATKPRTVVIYYSDDEDEDDPVFPHLVEKTPVDNTIVEPIELEQDTPETESEEEVEEEEENDLEEEDNPEDELIETDMANDGVIATKGYSSFKPHHKAFRGYNIGTDAIKNFIDWVLYSILSIAAIAAFIYSIKELIPYTPHIITYVAQCLYQLRHITIAYPSAIAIQYAIDIVDAI